MRVPRLSIEMLVAIIAVAEIKSTVLAAKELGLTPSAVHKRIDKANELLGAQLFINTDRGLVLTDDGAGFYRDALRAIQHALLAEDKMAAALELEAGHLSVGRSTYLPPRLLAMVLKLGFEAPSAYRIEYRSGLTPSLAQHVVEGTMHAGLGELPVDNPELLSRVLWQESTAVCLPAKHPLAVKPAIRPEDLREESIIAVERDLQPRSHKEIDEFFRGFGVELKIVADAFGPPEAVVMVEQKIGICLLAPSDITKPTVVGKPLSPQTLTHKYGLFVREDNHHPAVRAFVELALEQIGRKQH